MGSTIIGRNAVIAERRKLALEFRQAGLTYRELAVALTNKGFPCKFSCAYGDVMKALDDIAKKTHEEAEQLRTLELTRLDTMLKHIWARVLKGDTAAVDRALKISERRSKLLGLNAPERKEISTPDDIKIEINYVDADDS